MGAVRKEQNGEWLLPLGSFSIYGAFFFSLELLLTYESRGRSGDVV